MSALNKRILWIHFWYTKIAILYHKEKISHGRIIMLTNRKSAGSISRYGSSFIRQLWKCYQYRECCLWEWDLDFIKIGLEQYGKWNSAKEACSIGYCCMPWHHDKIYGMKFWMRNKKKKFSNKIKAGMLVMDCDRTYVLIFF